MLYHKIFIWLMNSFGGLKCHTPTDISEDSTNFPAPKVGRETKTKKIYTTCSKNNILISTILAMMKIEIS